VEYTVEFRDPRDLTKNPRNPYQHPPVQQGRVRESLQRFGWVYPVVVNDRSGRIVDGHERVEQAIALGAREVPVYAVDLSPTDEREMLLVLNRTTEERGQKDDVLLELLQEHFKEREGPPAGWQMVEYEQLLKMCAPPPESGLIDGVDGDELPEIVPTRATLGDLWALGKHRVLCGDATDPEEVVRLLKGKDVALCLTDPPYNVGVDYGACADRWSVSEYETFSIHWWNLARLRSKCLIMTPGIVNLGLWYSGRAAAIPDWIAAWHKPNQCSHNALGGFNCWEPFLVWGTPEERFSLDAWEFPVKQQEGVGDHPCPKLLAVWAVVMEQATRPGSLVYDPFAGSGTTVIAAEQLGRVCYAMEKTPHYCDLTIARWEKATGRSAELIEQLPIETTAELSAAG
jgi:DNA modification methylase